MRKMVVLVFVLLFGCSSQQEKSVQPEEATITTPPVESTPAVSVLSTAPPRMSPEETQKRYFDEQIKEAESLSENWKIPSAPGGMIPTGTNFMWTHTLALALANIQTWAEGSDEASYKDRRFQILGAYGLLQQGGFGSTGLPRAITAIFLSKTMRNQMYKWAIPSIQTAFKEMYPQDRRDYVTILKHARRYLDTADFKLETEYLEGLKTEDGCLTETWQKKFHKFTENEGCSERVFAYSGPKGGDDRYRKIEIFIYRRVVQDEWPLADMKTMLDQLISDLPPTT